MSLWPRENHTFEGGAPVFSRKKCTFWSGPYFCRFCISHFFQWKVYILECPSWRHSSIPEGKVHIFFYFLSVSFSFFQFLSVSFSFFQLLSASVSFCQLLSFSFIFIHFTFIFFHCFCLSFFFLFFFFLGCSKSFFFLPRLPHGLLLKFFFQKKKTFFLSSLGGVPHWAVFFSLVFFFIVFFIFVFFFNVFRCFSFFAFVFPLFIFYFFIFLLFFLERMFLPFSFCFSFFFSRVLKIWGGTPGFLGEKVHILSWLHLLCIGSSSLILVERCTFMIRLRVVFGGRRVGQVLPSYQNRQISALDETADAPQSRLSPSSLSHFISVL